MHDAALMKIPYRIDNWADDIPGLFLSVDFLFKNFFIELASREVFEHKVDIFFVRVEVIKLNNIGMADVFHDINLSFEQNLLLFVHLLPELATWYFFMIFIATGLPVFFYRPFTTFA